MIEDKEAFFLNKSVKRVKISYILIFESVYLLSTRQLHRE